MRSSAIQLLGLGIAYRFPKIRAWATNRIPLDGLAGCYINASPITLGENRYIASQGPTEEDLIWRMVWQCEVSVIVMLTPLVEKDEEMLCLLSAGPD